MLSDTLKPLVDLGWFSAGVFQLTGRYEEHCLVSYGNEPTTPGTTGLSSLLTYIISGMVFLRLIRPDLAGLTAKREELGTAFSLCLPWEYEL